MIATPDESQKLQEYMRDQHKELEIEIRQILVGNSEANINKVLDKVRVTSNRIICKLADSIIRVSRG